MLKLKEIGPVEFKQICARVLNFCKNEMENNIGVLTEISKQEEAI